MKTKTLLLGLVFGLVTVAALGLAWFNTQVDWVKEPGRGPQIVLARDANLVVAPLALLAFAVAFECLRRRRLALAALALPGFPVWCAVLLLTDTWLVNMGMGLAAAASFGGFAPFGPPG